MQHRFDAALTDAKVVEEIIDNYMKEQEERGKPPTVAGIGHALGIHRDTVRRYARGENLPELKADGSNRDEVEKRRAVCVAVYRAYLRCDSRLQDTLMEHGGNNGAMFYAKNCFDYTDRQDISATIQVPRFSGEDALE